MCTPAFVGMSPFLPPCAILRRTSNAASSLVDLVVGSADLCGPTTFLGVSIFLTSFPEVKLHLGAVTDPVAQMYF